MQNGRCRNGAFLSSGSSSAPLHTYLDIKTNVKSRKAKTSHSSHPVCPLIICCVAKILIYQKQTPLYDESTTYHSFTSLFQQTRIIPEACAIAIFPSLTEPLLCPFLSIGSFWRDGSQHQGVSHDWSELIKMSSFPFPAMTGLDMGMCGSFFQSDMMESL